MPSNPHKLNVGETPFGALVDTTLIVCLSSKHRDQVAAAFETPARYVIPGWHGYGRYEKAIIFTPAFTKQDEAQRWEEWIQTCIMTALKPDGRFYMV